MNSIEDFFLDLGFGIEIEHILDTIYEQLDLLLSYKRRYKYLKFVFESIFQ